MFGVWEAIYLLSVFINTFYNEIYVICLQERAGFKEDTEREIERRKKESPSDFR